MRTHVVLLACAASLATGCASAPDAERSGVSTTESPVGPRADRAPGAVAASDPKLSAVALPASGGWNAALVLDQGAVGVWTVGALKVFPQFACPEIVGLDDLGRLHALWSYSGKWTPATTVYDGKWLGGLVQADLDPRVPGSEIYTGSQNGNLWQVTAHLEAFLD